MKFKWYITGDCHGDFSKFYHNSIIDDPNAAVVILGDSGFNYWPDNRIKEKVKDFKCYLYCVYGNHEARPSDVEGMRLIWDENVGGEVWYEEKYERIRYFREYGLYTLGVFTVFIVGGAYSIDKYLRLANGWRWFKNEQLNDEEKFECQTMLQCADKPIDFFMSHTAPYRYEPTELFLYNIDQNNVDKRMELFLDDILPNNDNCIKLFGHYHGDMFIRPYVEIFYNKIEKLDDIARRWEQYAIGNHSLVRHKLKSKIFDI